MYTYTYACIKTHYPSPHSLPSLAYKSIHTLSMRRQQTSRVSSQRSFARENYFCKAKIWGGYD